MHPEKKCEVFPVSEPMDSQGMCAAAMHCRGPKVGHVGFPRCRPHPCRSKDVYLPLLSHLAEPPALFLVSHYDV